MSLDRARRDEELLGDLLIRKSLSDQLEDLVFTFADPECAEISFVELKWSARIDNFRSRQTESGPNSQSGEHDCDRSHVEFERDIPDEKPVLDELQEPDEDRHRCCVYENGFTHGQKQSHQTRGLMADNFRSKNGGDDRIRTCGTLLEYNGLANRRFQPLSHVSEYRRESQIFILAVVQTLSRYIASNSPTTLVFGA